MNLKESFTYMFKSNRWYVPVFIAFAVVLSAEIISYIFSPAKAASELNIGILLMNTICEIVRNVIIGGYSITNTNKRILYPSSNLQSWNDTGKIILTGLKCIFAKIIYLIPICIVSGILFTSYMKSAFSIDNTQSQTDGAFLQMSQLFSVETYIFIVINLILVPAFSLNLNFSSCFNLKLIFNIIKNNITGFVILTAFTFLCIPIGRFMHNLTIVSPIFLIFIALVDVYVILIYSDIIAQYVRVSTERNSAQNED